MCSACNRCLHRFAANELKIPMCRLLRSRYYIFFRWIDGIWCLSSIATNSQIYHNPTALANSRTLDRNRCASPRLLAFLQLWLQSTRSLVWRLRSKYKKRRKNACVNSHSNIGWLWCKTYNVMHESCSILCHQLQPFDLQQLSIVALDRVTQAKRNSVLVNGTTSRVLVCLPNRNFRQTLGEMVRVDQVRPVYIGSHLCWMDAPVDNHELVILHWLWYRNSDDPFFQLVLAHHQAIYVCLVGP